MGLLLRRKLRKVAAVRAPYVVDLSEYRPAPPELVTALLSAISSLLPVRDFPILPSDNPWTLFDLDQGCVENEIENVLERFAPSAPPLGAEPDIPPPETVRDVIRRVHHHAAPYLRPATTNS